MGKTALASVLVLHFATLTDLQNRTTQPSEFCTRVAVFQVRYWLQLICN
jgi:hypothetical protein